MSRWSAKRWLRAFRQTGGMAWRRSDVPLGLGWLVAGWSVEQVIEARRLYGEIEAVPLRYHATALQVAWSG